jgi:hypothetical protein
VIAPAGQSREGQESKEERFKSAKRQVGEERESQRKTEREKDRERERKAERKKRDRER